MAEVKFSSKASALQLLIFLDSLPGKDFPNMSAHRKILGGINEIRKGLGEYYTTLQDLEQKLLQKLQPYRVEASALLAKHSGDEKKPEYIAELATINAKVNIDKELVKCNDKIREFKEKNDKGECIIAISSEYLNAVREEWEKKAHLYEAWQPGLLYELDNLIVTL